MAAKELCQIIKASVEAAFRQFCCCNVRQKLSENEHKAFIFGQFWLLHGLGDDNGQFLHGKTR